jgi:hypothetical protein
MDHKKAAISRANRSHDHRRLLAGGAKATIAGA